MSMGELSTFCSLQWFVVLLVWVVYILFKVYYYIFDFFKTIVNGIVLLYSFWKESIMHGGNSFSYAS
jgi:hypothetical protein